MKSELELLCDKKKVTIKSYYGGVPQNENFPNSHPYKCVLRFKNRQLAVPFYMGEAHTQEPTAADVISCLISDTRAAEDYPDWVDFADAFGYLRESDAYSFHKSDIRLADQVRKAQKVHQECVKMAPRIRHFLGDDFDKFANAEH